MLIEARFRPIRVRFGGLICRAFEILHANAGGLYIQIPSHQAYFQGDGFPLDPMARIGELRGVMCGRCYRLTEDGRIISFPFAPMPGWICENFTTLIPPKDEPQAIITRTRCDRCIARLIEHAEEVFQTSP